MRTKELRTFNWEELDLSKVEDNGFTGLECVLDGFTGEFYKICWSLA